MGNWDEIISQAAPAAGIPTAVLEAIIQIESGGDPNAISPKGAAGLMQVMPQTAWLLLEKYEELNLRIRKIPEVSVWMGAFDLAEGVKWAKDKKAPESDVFKYAAAYYNGYPNLMAAARQKGEPLPAFDDLVDLLSEETRDYVSKFSKAFEGICG